MKVFVVIACAVCVVFSVQGGIVEREDEETGEADAVDCGPSCDIYCQFGQVMDERGCPLCKCLENPNCGPACNIYCQYGQVMDERGCPLCKCLEKPEPKCGGVCAIYCPFGQYHDESGCPICKCYEKKDNCITCMMACENGFVYEKGCPICKCK